MTQAAIRQLVADSVVAALEAQAANMTNTDNTNRNSGPRETHVARKCTYKDNCTKDWKVKFATGTLTEDALSWWNSYAKPIGIEQADKIAWTKLKRLLTNKYCPRTEVKKMEDEFYNLVVKGKISDLWLVDSRFKHFMSKYGIQNTKKLMKAFIGGLPHKVLKKMLPLQGLKLWRKPLP
ncbi:reverse transcriptase domain-containing protein [Tanacetum coccineum]